jgi:hypothetical protein
MTSVLEKFLARYTNKHTLANDHYRLPQTIRYVGKHDMAAFTEADLVAWIASDNPAHRHPASQASGPGPRCTPRPPPERRWHPASIEVQ